MGRDCGNQPSQERRRRLGAAGLVGQASWPVCFFCGAANDGCSRLSAGGGADPWADPLVCAGPPGAARRAQLAGRRPFRLRLLLCGAGFSLMPLVFPISGIAAAVVGLTSRSARVLQDPLFAQRNQPYLSTKRPAWTSAAVLESCPTNNAACPKWKNEWH